MRDNTPYSKILWLFKKHYLEKKRVMIGTLASNIYYWYYYKFLNQSDQFLTKNILDTIFF